MLFRELLDRFLNLAGQFLPQHAVLWVGSQPRSEKSKVAVLQLSLGGLVKFHLLPPTPGCTPSQQIDAEVSRDPEQPGLEAGLTLEVIQMLVDLGKCLLGNLHRFLLVPDHSERERVEFLLVALHQNPKGSLIAAADALDQGEVVGSQRALDLSSDSDCVWVSRPGSGVPQYLDQPGLFASQFRLKVVDPSDPRGQRHQDRFGAATGLEPA